ncbi:hypothetical protein NKH18_25060 [Streptomyces sp. M10(2022)]
MASIRPIAVAIHAWKVGLRSRAGHRSPRRCPTSLRFPLEQRHGKIPRMRILVMGGTWFLGKQIVQQALARGWDVTTFNRGRSGADAPGLRPSGVTAPWPATCPASPPRDRGTQWWIRRARTCRRGTYSTPCALREMADRWVHVSTVSVYEGWPHQPITEASPVLDCPPDADASFGYTGADGSPTAYGFQKAGAERAVEEAFGDSSVFLRPGVILGPEEYVGRLPWWLTRTARAAGSLHRLRPTGTSSPSTSAMSHASQSTKPLPPPPAPTTSPTPRASPSRVSSTRASQSPMAPAARSGRSPSCSPSRL